VAKTKLVLETIFGLLNAFYFGMLSALGETGLDRRPSGKYGRRRGISPILATVLIIAVTLVASVAIGGLAYGVLGSAANSAQVQVMTTIVPAAIGYGVDYAYCSTTPGNIFGGYIQLYNSGTGSTSARVINFVYDGVTVDLNPSSANPCTIAPDSSLYLVILSLPLAVSRGVPYSGFVSTANGAEVLFTGTFD
jgi:flagellin-like protein